MIDEYQPDHAVSPWATVAESVMDWIGEDRPITQEVADALSALHIGVPSSFFVNLERQYRETLARLEAGKCSD